MKNLQFLDNVITQSVNVALVTIFTVMMTLAGMQVFLRYFFNSSILWGDIAARNLVIWVGILGAVLATRDNKHFHIDVLSRFLGRRYQLWFQSFSNLFSSAICFFLGQASITFLELDSQTRTFLDIPAFYVEIIIPVGFYLMMVQFLLRMTINDEHSVSHEKGTGHSPPTY